MVKPSPVSRRATALTGRRDECDALDRLIEAVGAGESSALDFKGKPTPGKSVVPPAEITASYRRQAEQELNSERVPDALKETIRNYFMSLGETNK